MSTIYIDRRNVTATNRNKRITEYTNNTTTSGNNGGGSGVYLFENGVKVTGSTVSLSGEYSGYTENLGQWKITGATKNEIIVTGTTGTTGTTIVYDVTGFTGNTVEIKGDVFIDGNLKVSKEVTAYFASELTGSTFDLLSVSQPLLKEGTNISLMYDSEKLVINDSGELTLTSGFTENLSLTWENINNKPSTFPPSAHTHTERN